MYVGLLGLTIGSFLNVVIARVPNGESVVRPRSRCPKCGHQLPWYENIPVLSWLMLRGKCSGCKTPISPRYILVECLTGILFLACVARYGFTWPLVPALLFISLLVPLIFIDAELWILPFELTLPGIAFGILLQLPHDVAWLNSALSITPHWPALSTAFIGAVAGYMAFRTMELFGWLAFRREALGAGDKFLLAMIGAFLGGPALMGVIALSSLQGALWGLAMMLRYGRAGPDGPGVKKDGAPGETPADQPAEEESDEPEPTFTPEFLRPGLSPLRRMASIPYALFLQPIPDDPPLPEGADENAEPEWVPGPTNMPFGPWLGLAALEVMLIGPWLVTHFEGTSGLFFRILLGQWN